MSEIWERDLQDGITLKDVVTVMAEYLFEIEQKIYFRDDENRIRELEEEYLPLLVECLVGRHDGNVPPLEDTRGLVFVEPHPNGSVSVEIWRGGQCIIQRTIDRPHGGPTHIGQARAMARAVFDQCQRIETVPAVHESTSSIRSARGELAARMDALCGFVVEHEHEFQHPSLRPSLVAREIRAWLKTDRLNRNQLLAILHLPEVSETAIRRRLARAMRTPR